MKHITVFLFFLICISQVSFGADISAERNSMYDMQESSTDFFFAAAFDTTQEYISIPNAFIPRNAITDLAIFKPVVHHEIISYTMLIYDRWGNLLFESKDPDIGWNGSYKGVICSVQAYVYKITYKPILPDGSVGKELTKTGTINLLE